MKSSLRVLGVLVILLVGAALLILLAAAFTIGDIWFTGLIGIQHALGIDTQASKNYDSVSGHLPIIVTAFGFSGVFVTIYKHINCEHPGCLWPGHRHPNHGRPVCRRHYHSDVVPPIPNEAP